MKHLENILFINTHLKDKSGEMMKNPDMNIIVDSKVTLLIKIVSPMSQSS